MGRGTGQFHGAGTDLCRTAGLEKIYDIHRYTQIVPEAGSKK